MTATATEILKLLPAHDCAFFLTHNEHKSYYQDVATYLASRPDYLDFVSDEEKKKAIESNELWFMQWYPRTPIGFNTLAASTLHALLEGVHAATH